MKFLIKLKRYFALLSLIFYANHLSWAQDNTSELVADSFQSVMDYVAETETEAPAAARIYAITAITLHDIWQISQNEQTFLNVTMSTHAITKHDMSSAFHTAIQALIESGFDLAKIPHAPKTDSQIILRNVLKKIALPQPILQTIPETFIEEVGAYYVHPEWKNAPPLTLTSAAMFRPLGPPLIGSEVYESAFEEVRQLGEDVSEYRLSDHSLTAAFWGDAAGTYTGPGHWNAIALTATTNLLTPDRLKVLLALNVAMYDVSIAAWESKYYFMAERPTPAIRRLSAEDSTWNAMGDIPRHPEYVSGHSAFSAAAAKVLTLSLGSKTFCSTVPHLWDLTRCFESFDEAAKEAGQSRIYGGIHFQFANQDGLKLGKTVGHHSYQVLKQQGLLP